VGKSVSTVRQLYVSVGQNWITALLLLSLYPQTIRMPQPHLSKGKWNRKDFLTHCGQVTQICVFTLQLCRTGDADLRF